MQRSLLSPKHHALAYALAAAVHSSTVPEPWDWSARSACLLIGPDALPGQTQDQLHTLNQVGLLDLTVPLTEDPSTAVLRPAATRPPRRPHQPAPDIGETARDEH